MASEFTITNQMQIKYFSQANKKNIVVLLYYI